MTERGSLLPMVAGLLALCGVAIVGIVDATDLAITRTSLQSTADLAALVGAESFDPRAATFDGSTVSLRLTNRRVRRAVRSFVAVTTDRVRVRSALTLDGVTARVTVATVWEPPLGSEFLPVRLPITATASARAVLGASTPSR